MSVFLTNLYNGFRNGPTKKLICVSSRNFENSNKIPNLEFGGHTAGKIQIVTLTSEILEMKNTNLIKSFCPIFRSIYRPSLKK